MMHFLPSKTALSSMEDLTTKLWDQLLGNVFFSIISVLSAFFLMAIMSFFGARSFLEPLRVISDYALQKDTKGINKGDVEKEIKPLKIPNVPFIVIV